MNSRRPSSRNDFDIAIICALPFERDAVEALLDEDYEQDGYSYGKAIGDKNAYTIGRLGKQHVIVAHMPGAGTISAAAVAANLTSSFPKVQLAFVVGICGGIPISSQQDGDNVEIRLGDVIISTSVIQIDFGRQYPNGFRRKKEAEAILGRANPEIRSFVGKLSGYRSRKSLTDKIYVLLNQITSMKHFASSAYPASQHDIRYAANHRHKHWNSDCSVCDNCEDDNDDVCDTALESYCSSLGCKGVMVADTPEARKPAVHFGRVACSNHTIKSGYHRDQLAIHEKVIGFEMESAGTWDYVPTIVVKSVSDYADSHKNKQWQKYAAAVAAACAKAMLEDWRNVDQHIEGYLWRKTDRISDLPSRPAFPVHTTVTRAPNPLFTGRNDVLSDLRAIIRGAVEDSNNQEPCHIVISGMGGQGKSEICLQLAHQLRKLFWGTFWVDVSTTTLAENGFLEVVGRLGVAATTWEVARQELANVKQPWMLVLDNADNPEFDYQPYFPASTFGVVILTSRNAECERYATKKWIDLEGLAPTDARDLLLRVARVSDTRRESFEADAEDVVQLLQSHPLALVQAGSYVGRGHCSLKQYPGIYEHQRKRLLAFRPVQAGSRYRDVYATFEASIETLKMLETEAASDAMQLLPLLAMYGPSRLPILLFENAWKVAQTVSTGEVAGTELYLLTAWHIACLPPFLEMEADTWDPFRPVEALNLLKTLSLISIDTELSSLSVSMHPLVHAWARDRMTMEEQHTYWLQAGSIIALTYYKRYLWKRYPRQLQSHLQAITSWSMRMIFQSDRLVDTTRILISCGHISHTIQDHTTLSALVDLLFTNLELDCTMVNRQWVEVYKLATYDLHCSGRIKDGLKLSQQVLDIEQQTLAENDSRRVLSQCRLAKFYQDNGQAKDAVKLLEQAVTIQKGTKTEDDRIRPILQRTLARAYLANKQVEDAIKFLEHVVETMPRTRPEDDYYQFAPQRELARAYRKNGQVEDAIRLMEYEVGIAEQTLAENHPSRLASQCELAICLSERGNVETVVDMLRHVANIQELSLDEHHPNQKKVGAWLNHLETKLKQNQNQG